MLHREMQESTEKNKTEMLNVAFIFVWFHLKNFCRGKTFMHLQTNTEQSHIFKRCQKGTSKYPVLFKTYRILPDSLSKSGMTKAYSNVQSQELIEIEAET